MLGWLPVFSSAGWFRSAVGGRGYVSSGTVCGVRRAAGPLVIPSPRRGGMTRYANEVLAGWSIRTRDHAAVRGSGPARPAQARKSGSGRSCGDPRSVEGTDVAVPHRVVHIGQLLPGGGGLADVAAAAVPDPTFQASGAGARAEGLDRLDRRPPHQPGALLGDPAPVNVGV